MFWRDFLIVSLIVGTVARIHLMGRTLDRLLDETRDIKRALERLVEKRSGPVE